MVAVCDLIHLTAVSNFPLSLRRTLNIISALIESSLEVDEICSMIPSHGSGEKKESIDVTHVLLVLHEGFCSFSLHLFVTYSQGENVWEYAGVSIFRCLYGIQLFI